MDGKAAGFKLEVALATPVAGESLNRPDESKLSSVRFLLSPLVWLRQPRADLRSACHGGDDWVWESDAAGSECKIERSPKAFPLEGKVGGFSRSDEV